MKNYFQFIYKFFVSGALVMIFWVIESRIHWFRSIEDIPYFGFALILMRAVSAPISLLPWGDIIETQMDRVIIYSELSIVNAMFYSMIGTAIFIVKKLIKYLRNKK